jgi:PAS domain S-box-containing protein
MSFGGKACGRPRLRGLLALAVVLTGPVFTAAGPNPHKLVVVLYPDESDGAPGMLLVDRAIRTAFASQSPGAIDVRNEYLESARLRDPDFKAAQVALLQRKYAGRKIDLVIAGLSSGLDFALENRQGLFPGVPIVFTAVDRREIAARRLPPDVIGVPIEMDLAGTLDLALRLHPDTRRVFVVAGSSPFDAAWTAEARQAFARLDGRLEFVYLTGLPMDELLDRVAALPAQSLIYYLHVFKDGNGKAFFPAEALDHLAKRANSPVYGHVGTYVGRGIVGGHVFGFENEGRSAAGLALRILSGEKAESISVAKGSQNSDVFDWRQLRRWGIGEENLPPGSEVLFRELTFWDVYHWHVIGVASFCVLQSLLIVGLIVQRVKRRRADERFRQVVETAPNGLLMIGRDGRIVMANNHVDRLFGYSRKELIGQPVELLVPANTLAIHPAERDRFYAAPETRPMGPGREVAARRKDGSEFPVEVGLSPLHTPHGVFILASVIDLTARRRTEDELRTSRRELQHLTGRLLEAQEAERRRIARELHDDLSQGLALLAVEIDILRRKPPPSAAALADHLHALTTRVRELSAAVHALSHQLHPSKLEHLGLVAALRGLCEELTLHHALDVEFVHDDLPGPIPESVALCLYRIAQEALRNVVKHADTAHTRVELTGTPGTILLRVSDDGPGFDPGAIPAGDGLGLVSMRERLGPVGGEITIDTCPGGGTRIGVRVPVSAPPSERPEQSLELELAGG